MKNGILLVLFLSAGIAVSQESVPGSVQSPQVIQVATALNHITVIELGEPITLAAAGSSAFRIERHADKVFIEPLKAGAATDLVVWTNTRRFTYELETTGDVRNMNFAIVSPPPVSTPVIRPDQLDDSRMNEIADMVLTRGLLGAEQVDSRTIRTPRNRVSIRIEHVVHSRNTTYIHFTIENLSKTSYVVPEPSLTRLELLDRAGSLADLRNQQLTDAAIQTLGSMTAKPIPVAHSETAITNLLPGHGTQGVLAIREPIDTPTAIQLKFESKNQLPVIATVVF